MSEIFDKIKEFTVEQTGVKKHDITYSSSLENDLGIYGDDAVDFIIAFSKKFNVDITNFMAADYISAEGIDVLGPVVGLFRRQEKKDKKDLTMQHLEKAVIVGRLDEAVING